MAQYGAVKDIRMATDDKGQPKGFAFVEFESEVRKIIYAYRERLLMVTTSERRAGCFGC